MKLEQVLVDRGVLTLEAIERATREAEATRSPIGHVLLRDGLVTEEQVGWHVAEAHGLPFVHLALEMVDATLAKRAGSAFLRTRCALPLTAMWGEVTVVVADPETAGPADEIRRALGDDLEVHVAVAQESKIRAVLDTVFGGADLRDGAKQRSLDDPAGVAPLYGHLARAARSGAEQLRFDPTPDGLVVRVRRDGETQVADRLPEHCAHAVAARARILLEGASSGRVPTRLLGRDAVLAIEIVPTRCAEAVIVRIERTEAPAARTFESLVGGSAAAAMRAVLAGPVVLVAGRDETSRRALAEATLSAASGCGEPVAVVDPSSRSRGPADALVLAPEHLDRVAALAPRVLLVDDLAVTPEQVRDLVAVVPGILLVRPERSAAGALALCPDALRRFVRGAIGPDGFVEVRSWI